MVPISIFCLACYIQTCVSMCAQTHTYTHTRTHVQAPFIRICDPFASDRQRTRGTVSVPVAGTVPGPDASRWSPHSVTRYWMLSKRFRSLIEMYRLSFVSLLLCTINGNILSCRPRPVTLDTPSPTWRHLQRRCRCGRHWTWLGETLSVQFQSQCQVVVLPGSSPPSTSLSRSLSLFSFMLSLMAKEVECQINFALLRYKHKRRR